MAGFGNAFRPVPLPTAASKSRFYRCPLVVGAIPHGGGAPPSPAAIFDCSPQPLCSSPMPRATPPATELLTSLEQRQDDLLSQIDALNDQIESALDQLSSSREEVA